jgi:hypothetical protein
MRSFNDVLVSQPGERPADGFDRQAKEIGNVRSADLKLNSVRMTAAAGVIRYKGSNPFGCRPFVEHRKLLPRLRQFIGQQFEIFRLKERLFANTAMGNAKRKRAQCHRRGSLRAGKLLTMGTDTDDIASSSKSYDLPTPICEQAIQAHEAGFDPIDVAFFVAFEECVLVDRKMPNVTVLQQAVRYPSLRTSHERRERQRVDSDLCVGKHLSISPDRGMTREEKQPKVSTVCQCCDIV